MFDCAYINKSPRFQSIVSVWGPWQQVHGDVYRNCGGEITENRGFIHSPNFPNPFPDPISCTWVIRAPPGKKIHLYFTQYFLREAVYLVGFDTYTSQHVFTGRTHLGSFGFEDEVTSVAVYKSVLAVDFRVRGKENIHLRVEEFLTDVYGFNITYEVVDIRQPIRNFTCSVHDCSFLGHCYVRADWSQFHCLCFPGYFGPQCQFGPHCNPEAGLNTCHNAGMCRYFYGSDVNMCDCLAGFTGVLCEIPTDTQHPALLDEGCARLGCTQLCDRDHQTGQAVCACRDRFRLHTDNRTCHLIERHVVRVDLLTRDTHHSQQDVLSDDFSLHAQQQLDKALMHYGLPSSQQFKMDGFTKMAVSLCMLRFQFLTDSSRVRTVEVFLYMLAMRGSFFNFSLVNDGVQVFTTPELHLLEVENYEKRAAPEGGFSNLLCMARGSDRMQFRWYKDGRLFNSSLTARNVWNSKMSEASSDRYTAILNINDITSYDKGRFTCEVEDYGTIQRRDIDLDVVTSPVVVIAPLAANVRRGEGVSFRCFTPDEGQFTYTWLKNGEPLSPRVQPVTMEDVQPFGKRLNILRAEETANYTCVIEDHKTTSSSTVHVFVNTTDERCGVSVAVGVTWQPAVHAGTDVQKCPHTMHGLASRSCSCPTKGCRWSLPNLSRCQTAAFIAVFDQMEQLILGYQGQSVKSVLTELWKLLTNISAEEIIPGDVTLASRIILNSLTAAAAVPDILTSSPDILSTQFLLKLLGFLIGMTGKATAEEWKEQQIVSRCLLSLELMSELHGNGLTSLTNGSYNALYLEARIMEYTEYMETGSTVVSNITKTQHLVDWQQKIIQTSPEKMLNLTRQRRFWNEDTTSRVYSTAENEAESQSVQKTQQMGGQGVTKYHTIRKNNSYNEAGGERFQGNKTFQVLDVFHSRSLSMLNTPATMDSHNSSWQTVSGLRSVLPLGDLWGSKAYLSNVTIHHVQQKTVFEDNETVCFALLIDRESLKERWSSSRCEVLWTSTNFTTCLCPLPVHVAVFVRPLANMEHADMEPSPVSFVVFMGCVIALCWITAILLTYLLACRNVRSVFHLVRVNLIFSLFLLVSVCVTCFQGRHLVMLCLTGRLLIHLAMLGAFSFLFVDSIHMYIVVHALSPRVLSDRCCKFFAIGWGIPVLSVGSTAAISSHYGHSDRCNRWCWVQPGVWQFYPFLVPMLVFVSACILIYVKCVSIMCTWKDNWRSKDRTKHVSRAVKNVFIMVVLIGVTWAGCDLETQDSYSVQIVFVILLLILVGAVFFAYCISERMVIRAVLFCIRPQEESFMKTCSSNSFRAFVMPERIEERCRSKEKQNIHRLCTQRDNSRFTTERKRQLRFLLGTSASSCNSSQTGSFCAEERADAVDLVELPTTDRTVEYCGGEGQNRQHNVDSGIFWATDSDKSPSSGRHHSHSNSNSDVSEALLPNQVRFQTK